MKSPVWMLAVVLAGLAGPGCDDTQSDFDPDAMQSGDGKNDASQGSQEATVVGTAQLQGEIMSSGLASPAQLESFVLGYNRDAAAFVDLPELTRLYVDEAAVEGVNHDIAFVQMCYETNFLRFDDGLLPATYNFGVLGGLYGDVSFPDARTGVRAHVQHLLRYASDKDPVHEIVDPRWRFVTPGIAPRVHDLSGRWTADRSYGAAIMRALIRLYARLVTSNE